MLTGNEEDSYTSDNVKEENANIEITVTLSHIICKIMEFVKYIER